MWLLEDKSRQIYSEKKQAEQGKIQNVQLKEERNNRKFNRGKSCVQRDKKIKEKPDAKWNIRLGDLKTIDFAPGNCVIWMIIKY